MGIVLAGITIAGGYLTSLRDESELASLVAKCRSEASAAPKGPWLDYQKAPLVCDPIVLSKLTAGDAVGIQREIVESASSSGEIYRISIAVAILLFVGFSLPYAWYFLLRRIRELSGAIRHDG